MDCVALKSDQDGLRINNEGLTIRSLTCIALQRGSCSGKELFGCLTRFLD